MTLEPEDVPPANQFYTPHWVVRMLADNSLGKLYLERPASCRTSSKHRGTSPMSERDRLVTPDESPDGSELSVPISSRTKTR